MESDSMPTTDTQGNARILIASGDQTLARHYVRNLQDNFSTSAVSDPDHALREIESNQPDLVLIDPKLFPGDLSVKITGISDTASGLRIMVIENQTDRAIDQYALFKAGAHGFCHENISSSLLNKAVQLVH